MHSIIQSFKNDGLWCSTALEFRAGVLKANGSVSSNRHCGTFETHALIKDSEDAVFDVTHQCNFFVTVCANNRVS